MGVLLDKVRLFSQLRNLTSERIFAAHGTFIRIRQVVSMFSPYRIHGSLSRHACCLTDDVSVGYRLSLFTGLAGVPNTDHGATNIYAMHAMRPNYTKKG